MSFLWIKEKFRKSGQFGVSQDDLTRHFELFSDDPVNDDVTDAKEFVQSEFGITKGTAHPKTPTAWCRSVNVTAGGDKSLGLYSVECPYSNGPLSQREQDKISQPNPMLRPAVINVVTSRGQRVPQTDRNGLRFDNTAWDLIDPPPVVDVTTWQIRVRKNYEEMPPWFDNLADTINAASIHVGQKINRSFLPRCVKFAPEGVSESQVEGDYTFIEISFLMDILVLVRRLGSREIIVATDEQLSGSSWETVGGGLVGTRVTGAYNDEWQYIPTQTIRRVVGWDFEYADAGFYYWPPGVAVGDRSRRNRTRFADNNASFCTIPQPLDGKDGRDANLVFASPSINYLMRGPYWLGDHSLYEGILA